MQRREFMALLGGAAAAVPMAVHAQPSPGRPLVGVLVPQTAAAWAPNLASLRTTLREFGYVEGRNIWLELRYADGELARLPALAAELAFAVRWQDERGGDPWYDYWRARIHSCPRPRRSCWR